MKLLLFPLTLVLSLVGFASPHAVPPGGAQADDAVAAAPQVEDGEGALPEVGAGPGLMARAHRDMEDELLEEERRGEGREDEIAAERARQEELLRELEAAEETGRGAARPTSSLPEGDMPLSERANPRAAPPAPRDRELPLAIFEKESTTIPAGAWENERPLLVTRRSLDADMDGRPEQIRYFDANDDMIRLEQDVDYDGDLDTWQTYANGQLVERRMDNSDDGRPDVWERYEQGLMVSRVVDRDIDGMRDAFYEYRGDSLVSERHDANGDGTMDLVVLYENRLRVRSEEDRNRDGRIDVWTTYGAYEGEEIVSKVERDTDGSGRADLVETYAEVGGHAVLTRREEDKNADGEMDIKSIYENGKLVKREINDPSLIPL